MKLFFGRHKGQDVADVPTSYLDGLATSGVVRGALLRAVREELVRRGVDPGPEPEPPPPPACRRCGPAGAVRYDWIQDRRGRRMIRQTCGACGARLGFAPQVPRYTAAADAGASPTAALDVLTRCEELGIALRTDGAVADFASWEDRRRAPAEVRALLGQCRHDLGRMLSAAQPGGAERP
jgi:hypothetical protein